MEKPLRSQYQEKPGSSPETSQDKARLMALETKVEPRQRASKVEPENHKREAEPVGLRTKAESGGAKGAGKMMPDQAKPEG